jgi:galactose mutarotase-like enzyme
MLHSIENEFLICSIESTGAEIRSLRNKLSGEEYIWQIDPSIWGSSSPILFPAIGKIKETKIVLNAQDYLMPKHGIIRNNDHLLFKQDGPAKCSFTLSWSEETLKLYPYKFSFKVEFSLKGRCLLMNYVVENKDKIPMPFACGGHTAYACPLNDDTKLGDYLIEFPRPLKLHADTLGATGLLSSTKREIDSFNGTLPLSDSLFNEDALIFSDIDFNWVRLRKKSKKKGIIVRFTDYPNLALWSKPGADYICIEPWLGLPDREDESTDITKKSSLKTIDPGTSYSIAIETEIE